MATVVALADIERSEYMTPSQIARAWGVHPDLVRRMIRNRALSALATPTGRYLVHRHDVARVRARRTA